MEDAIENIGGVWRRAVPEGEGRTGGQEEDGHEIEHQTNIALRNPIPVFGVGGRVLRPRAIVVQQLGVRVRCALARAVGAKLLDIYVSPYSRRQAGSAVDRSGYGAEVLEKSLDDGVDLIAGAQQITEHLIASSFRIASSMLLLTRNSFLMTRTCPFTIM